MSPQPAPTPPKPLSVPRDGIPHVTTSRQELRAYLAGLTKGEGPIAVDAERASGFRYGQQAYLIQIRRQHAGTGLIDPQALPNLSDLNEVISADEWVLHAANQDLPCLADVGLVPRKLFDTELAGRLLNKPRVGLASLVATELGYELAKEHSAADWSTRPLPQDWLRYAALDVEVLVELRHSLAQQLQDAGKWDWAVQEFEAIVHATPPQPQPDPWRRTSGIHKLRHPRQLAIVKNLWHKRDDVARQADLAPGRVLSDRAIIAAAQASTTKLMTLKPFQNAAGRQRLRMWQAAVRAALELPETELPQRRPARNTSMPHHRGWRPKEPESAARFEAIKRIVRTRALELDLPQENLLTPEYQRRLAWHAPEANPEDVADQLSDFGARQWQVENLAEHLAAALAHPQHVIDTVPDPFAQ